MTSDDDLLAGLGMMCDPFAKHEYTIAELQVAIENAAAAIRFLRAKLEANERGWKLIAEGYKTTLEVSQSNHAIELAAERKALAQFMLDAGFATGHGETHADLLSELTWQVTELKERVVTERKARADADGIAQACERRAEAAESRLREVEAESCILLDKIGQVKQETIERCDRVCAAFELNATEDHQQVVVTHIRAIRAQIRALVSRAAAPENPHQQMVASNHSIGIVKNGKLIATESLEQIALRIAAKLCDDAYELTQDEWRIEFARRLVAELGQGEPVAWQYVDRGGERRATFSDLFARGIAADGVKIKPLFSAPPVAPNAAQTQAPTLIQSQAGAKPASAAAPTTEES